MPLDAQLVELCQLLIIQLAIHQSFLHSLQKESLILLIDLSLSLLCLIYSLVVNCTVVGGMGCC